MIAVKNAVFVSYDSNKQEFIVKDLCTQKEAGIPVIEFFGTCFKYDLGFISRFTAAVNQYDDKPEIIITEDAKKRIYSLIEFNRIDNWSSISGATT